VGYGRQLSRLPTLHDAPKGGIPWASQLKIDHYYGSYRFYTCAKEDPSISGYDSPPPSKFDISFTKTLDDGGPPITISTKNYLLFLEEYRVHAPGNRSSDGDDPMYGRNAAYRDGHAKWMPGNEYDVR